MENNIMNRDELIKALDDRQSLQRIIDEAQAEMNAITDRIKAHMEELNVDVMTAGHWKVSWKYSKPRIIPDVDALTAAGLFPLYSKEQKAGRPFRVTA